VPNFMGPADWLVFEGRLIPRGEMVAVSGHALERLKRLGHQFEGHEQPAGPAFVDQPVPTVPAMGANGGPITTAEVLASSSEYQSAKHEAAVQEATAEEDKPARVEHATAKR
jgi:hypothetical protein